MWAGEPRDGDAGADGPVLAHAAAGHADVVQRGGAAGADGAGGGAGRGAVPHVAAGRQHPAPQRQRAAVLQPHHVHHGHRRLHQPAAYLRLQLCQYLPTHEYTKILILTLLIYDINPYYHCCV